MAYVDEVSVVMVQPFSWVLYNSVFMFVGAFGAGLLPLAVQLEDSRLRTVNMVGAGMMVGTALGVIIPEGAGAFYAAYPDLDDAPHGLLGLALVAGFLIMLALDSVQFAAASSPLDAKPESGGQERPISQMVGFTTLVGILVHSAADGIALGAAAFADNAATGALISLAIILHKAPTAFGLSTFLLKSQWSWRQVRVGLGLFAAAAPAVALVGYGVVGSIPALASPVGVALCLVLSGGTFIYAACLHILPEALAVADKGAHSHRVSRQQVAAIAVGALLPLVFSLGHSHSHMAGAEEASLQATLHRHHE